MRLPKEHSNECIDCGLPVKWLAGAGDVRGLIHIATVGSVLKRSLNLSVAPSHKARLRRFAHRSRHEVAPA